MTNLITVTFKLNDYACVAIKYADAVAFSNGNLIVDYTITDENSAAAKELNRLFDAFEAIDFSVFQDNSWEIYEIPEDFKLE